MSLFISGLAGFLAGVLGSMGLGGGGILIIYLTLFENMPQKLSQGINLIFFIPNAIIAVIYYIKKGLIDLKIVGYISLFGLFGAFLGNILLSLIETFWLSKIFAIFLLVTGIIQLFSPKKST